MITAVLLLVAIFFVVITLCYSLLQVYLGIELGESNQSLLAIVFGIFAQLAGLVGLVLILLDKVRVV